MNDQFASKIYGDHIEFAGNPTYVFAATMMAYESKNNGTITANIPTGKPKQITYNEPALNMDDQPNLNPNPKSKVDQIDTYPEYTDQFDVSDGFIPPKKSILPSKSIYSQPCSCSITQYNSDSENELSDDDPSYINQLIIYYAKRKKIKRHRNKKVQK